ncbi:MAG: lycopene cyclase [Rhodococcus sp.]|nr:lycopene cyclase [Rhodococcus sp. (in: high G+C Gram-positive bacteria)]
MPANPPLLDVAVVGLGPAGRALSHRCVALGLSVVAIDPSPDRRWSATYGAWEDELPSWLPPDTIAGRINAPAVRTHTTHQLDRSYCVFDTALLQSILDIGAVKIIAGRTAHVGRSSVTMTDGTVVHARRVVDVRGVGDDPLLARQTAFGVIVDSVAAAPALEGRGAWFMDWKRDNGAAEHDAPSFLYAIPLDHNRVLLEETCLVGRPPLPVRELRRRLEARLERRGVAVPSDAAIERVSFTVEPPAVPLHGDDPLAFGARGGLIHPGTGYSVAAALAHADPLAQALAGRSTPEAVLWPRSARLVAGLRHIGLQVLLDLDSAHAIEFFDAFFMLPIPLQRAYLSSRTDAKGTLTAMWQLFLAAPPGVRRDILRTVFRR